MELIKKHLALSPFKDSNGVVHESSLVYAINQARRITGRNIETGMEVKGNSKELGNWIGAMGYIAILDQIGKCYRPNSENRISKKPSIIVALTYFATSLSVDEISAIYALRNAFFHDLSLINKDNTKNYHHFLIDNQDTQRVVILPPTKWDGTSARDEENGTRINLKALGDLVESIYFELCRMHDHGELEIDLKGGKRELEARYIFYHR